MPADESRRQESESSTPESLPPLGTEALDRFARSFEASARRWEMIVYPSLFAFIVLAAYGFFLIYSLTKDMHTLASSIDPSMHPHMNTMAVSVEHLAEKVSIMTERMTSMTVSVNDMTKRVSQMTDVVSGMNAHIGVMKTDMGEISSKLDALDPMLVNMSAMNDSMMAMNQSMAGMNNTMHVMGVNTATMSRDMSHMNYNVGRPLSMMNSFFPW